MRRARGALIALALLVAACDSAVGPEAVAGIYRLESYDGQHLPIGQPANFGGGRVERGELLLLPDGRFESAIATDLGPAGIQGTFAVSGSTLTITPDAPAPGVTYTVTIEGDVITFVIAVPPGGLGPVTSTLVWRRFTRRPPQIESGRYVLTAHNGNGPPFIVFDATFQGIREVLRVDFDSLELRSGLFFTRHWKETRIVYPAPGDSSLGTVEVMTRGSFLSQRDSVTLLDYGLPQSLTPGPVLQRDDLAVTSIGLERRLALPGPGPVVQTFQRY